MKRKLISCLTALILLLSLFGCGAQDNLTDDSVAGDNTAVEDNPANKNPDFSHLVLTKEQMLEDYDSIWVTYEENSPFLGVIERTHGVGYLEDTVQKYRKQIEEMELEGDDAMLELIMILFNSIYEACDIDRHAGVENADRYRDQLAAYQSLLSERADLQPWVDLLDTPEIAEWYDYYDYLISRMLAEDGEIDAEPGDAEAQWEEELNRFKETNLTLDILEEGKTAYIKVDSFDTAFMEEDVPRIRSFMEEISDYGHLIIDVQHNGGGNSDYWEEAFVRPNISETVTTSFVRLMRDGSLATRLYSSNYEGSTLTVEDVRRNPAYTALQLSDMDQFAFATEWVSLTEPLVPGERLFQGEIWVLVGPDVYSATEAFAVFCKATGFATLVGQLTGGGNTGGPVLYELPNSHQLVTFDVEYALNPDGSCSQEQGTTPDILSDDALQTVLDLIAAG